VLDSYFVPQDLRGLNGESGWQSGIPERRLSEEGSFPFLLPDGPGPDGLHHRERLAITSDPTYRAGEEWFEVWQEGAKTPLIVATPVGAKVGSGVIEVRAVDALFLLRRAREQANAVWHHAPRDVIEFYTQVYRQELHDEFESEAITWATSETTVYDGRFKVLRGAQVAASDGYVQLYPNQASSATIDMYVRGAGAYTVGPGSSEAHGAWKVDGQLTLLGSMSPTVVRPFGRATTLALGLDDGAGSHGIAIEADFVTTGPAEGTLTWYLRSGTTRKQVSGPVAAWPLALKFSIEARGEWAWCYLNGTLLGTIPLPSTLTGRPQVRAYWTTAGTDTSTRGVRVEQLGFRRTRPFLLRGSVKGDYELPRSLTPGGLNGEYFDERPGTAAWPDTLDPTREPYAARIDATLTGVRTPPAGPVLGTLTPDLNMSKFWAARWLGAIYLDLAAFDYNLRQKTGANMRVFVGKTRAGEALLSDWTGVASGVVKTTTQTGGLRAILGQVSGWYPIVVEFSNRGATWNNFDPSEVTLEYARSDAPSTWETVGGTAAGAPALSPLGCLTDSVRFDSHFEKLKQIADTFGLQFECAPRSLESGEFPGQVIPKVRIGRDTAKVLDEIEATGVASEISAEDVVDLLSADAAGIADPGGAAQLTAEMLLAEEVESGLFLHQDHESLADISFEALLAVRLESILALRSTAWEQVSARPRGYSELVDSFPLTDTLAKFDWAPGDGIRLSLPEIGVEDLAPRQITSISREIAPNGLKGASVGFRQRPRGFLETLKRLQRQYFAGRRTFQGALSIDTGTRGDATTDARIALPQHLEDVTSATLVVFEGAPSVTINGAGVVTTTGPGRYDITQHIGRDGSSPSMKADGDAGSYVIEIQRVQR
jgi:hypothetical protein